VSGWPGMRKLYDRFEDWANVTVYKPGPGLPIDIRRIDFLLLFFCLICVGYYWWLEGWIGAIKGALAYIFVAMTAYYVLRA
jgi:hypothetical protein